MNICEKNYKSIKKKFEHIYRFMNEKALNYKDNRLKHIQSIATREEIEALVIETDDNVYRLNSRFKPVEEAKKWAEQFNIISERGITVSIFGFGNGLMIRELLNRLNDDELMIIYEPSKEIFSYVINNYDITDILNDSRVHFILEEINEDEFPKLLSKNINWVNINLQITCKLPKYDEIFPDSYKVFNKIIIDNNDRVIIRKNSQSYFANYFVTNTIYNIKFIKDSITTEDLKKVFPKEIPVIIVSAGPSLDKNIEELQRAKGKAVIVSVDTAVRYLLNKNIMPDIIITVDPNNPPEYLDNERIMNVPMIIRTESNYKITYKHKGKKIFFEGHEYFNYLYKELNKKFPRMSSGGSVSTAAFAVCTNIGFEKIILIGQDLAYMNGATHAGGTVDVSTNNADDIFVEDIYGNQIKTRYDWYHYLTWLNNAVNDYVAKGYEVIDATEGGAKIRDTSIMPLSKVLDLYCKDEIDVGLLINDINQTFIGDEIDMIKKYIAKTIDELKLVIEKSKESIENCSKFIAEYKKSNMSYILEILKSKILINNKIIGELPVNLLLDTYIAPIVTKQLSDVYKKNEKEKENNEIYAFIEIYEANIKGAEDIEVMLKNLLLNM